MRTWMLPLIFATIPAIAATIPDDTLQLPSPIERHVSPGKTYAFEVKFKKSPPSSTGTLLHRQGDTWQIVWSHALPNRWRPRFFLVNNAGYAITFDDWELSKSRHAIMIYDPRGAATLDLAYDDLFAQLRTDPDLAARSAAPALGWWLGGEPKLFQDDALAVTEIAKRKIFIELATGKLIYPR